MQLFEDPVLDIGPLVLRDIKEHSEFQDARVFLHVVPITRDPVANLEAQCLVAGLFLITTWLVSSQIFLFLGYCRR